MIDPEYRIARNISRVIDVINNKSAAPRPRGRPRAFDREKAVAIAGHLFWRLGYEGTSIADLTAAMGITPQSLYAAFRSKADLYAEALRWYQAEIGAATAEALSNSDIMVAFERVLLDSAREFCKPGRPPGCMISTAVLTCAIENDTVAEIVAGLRRATLIAFRDRLQHAVDEGALRPDADVAALARFIGALVQGMSVQARDGATEAELTGIAHLGIAELHRHRMDGGR
ncbi:TetR/AcrR family transcriptional regulator [Niveispirillum sp. BGYR6]|uniref:TetR/AcrR family transcriptional regulator n=1 Tax=Niveispirillum sp. BGYR6 TaxID=2971249 RepID=UPI0022B9A001|nr:TetR/AcrR family transcriptional regulator [Niveispirillum sp. BGYR6]